MWKRPHSYPFLFQADIGHDEIYKHSEGPFVQGDEKGIRLLRCPLRGFTVERLILSRDGGKCVG